MALEANTSSLKCYIGIPKRTSQILKGWFAESEKIHPSMNKLVTIIKFLMFSPGLDNAFVILNSWHRSDKKASVEDRLGDTMSEAGVSKPLRMIFSRGFFNSTYSRWASWSRAWLTSSASTRRCWRLTPTSRSSVCTRARRWPSTLSIRWIDQDLSF